MALEEISRSRWFGFLDQFGRQHRRWLVTLEREHPDGQSYMLAHEVPLEGIVLTGEGVVEAELGGRKKAGPQKERVRNPERILLASRSDGAHEGLRIEQTDGGVTTLRFRATARPEQIDGLAG